MKAKRRKEVAITSGSIYFLSHFHKNSSKNINMSKKSFNADKTKPNFIQKQVL